MENVVDNIEKEIRFQELYTNYNRLVWTYLNKNIKNRTDREDVFQQIWLGIWESIDKIEPGKEHAFIRKVIMNQIHKLYYYSTRDRKWTKSMEAENSEDEEEFSLVDISKEIREQDDYEYLEIMDAIESILTEEEFQIFLAYFQGITKKAIEKAFNLSPYERKLVYKSIDEKLTKEFGAKKSIFATKVEVKLSKSEARKKAWAEGKFDNMKRSHKPLSKEHREAISRANKGNTRTKGYHWYNNGVESKKLPECPEGWVPGRLKLKRNTSKALIGYHWYNNGKEERRVKECPEGWVPGRLKK